MTEKSQYAYDAVNELSESSSSRDIKHYVTANDQPVVLPAKDWPRRPLSLVPDRMQSLIMLAYDVALVTFPILLIVKTGLVILAWRSDRNYSGDSLDFASPMTQRLIDVNGQLITIFAIAFVTIMSTLVRRYALYKAQTGAYITELEQLQGSISLLSSVRLVVTLRAYSVLSVGLIIVWCFQYLGSQANKYEYRLVASEPFTYVGIGIQGGDSPTTFENISDSEPIFGVGSTLFDLFQKADSDAASPQQKKAPAGMDVRGNALIPDLALLLDSIARPNISDQPKQVRGGWFDVSRASLTKSSDSFVSDLGSYFTIRNENATAVGNEGHENFDCVSSYDRTFLGHYQFSSSYLKFVCNAPIIGPPNNFPNNTAENSYASLNMTKLSGSEPRDTSGNPLRTFEYWLRWAGDASTTWTHSAVSLCSVSRLNYEAQVECKEAGCVVRKMRWKNQGSFESAHNYSTPFDNDISATAFLNTISHTQQLFIDLFWIDAWGGILLNSSYKPEDFDRVSSNITHGLNKHFNNFYTVAQEDYGTCATGGKATLYGAEYKPHYAIFPVFIAIDLIASFILLIAAILSVILRMRTIAPDILGAVSSLSRDNPYLDLPATGTALDGISRARMLRRVKVKLGDVSGHDGDVGRIALARVDTGSVHVTSLQRTATYV